MRCNYTFASLTCNQNIFTGKEQQHRKKPHFSAWNAIQTLHTHVYKYIFKKITERNKPLALSGIYFALNRNC